MIPEGIATIGKRAFYGNNDIVSVTMPESVDTIEQEAFCYCQNLNNINISGEIKKVGKLAFGFYLGNVTTGTLGNDLCNSFKIHNNFLQNF